ncbi:hypothetical protein ABEF92_008649 [Exophiala dermatitidis]|uniref:Uncharacterized protein n=1 Tax=Exophiala dermatitidis (strain ATCC 34100 / CBS 525.76 / NIH/UT8656) TaxID=858893 RepID=H6C2W1_EXODN|nr:uncharacterized protein HMPREF1120_06837 [Exophiala dermatitidis NIH/UT8656]EHY58835.1 hypothetical protein HMPREF1120_06837 [Exophiala dermatitidis NIH/UT8656]
MAIEFLETLDLKQIQAKSGLFEKMEFVVSDGEDENLAAIVRKTEQSPPAYSFNFLLNLRTGSFRITESLGHAMRAWIEVSQEHYLLLKAAPKDEDVEPDTFIIQIALRSDYNFKVEHAGQAFTLSPHQALRSWKLSFCMAKNQDYIEKHCRNIEIRIPDYKKATIAHQFDARIVRHILNNKDSIDARENAKPYCSVQLRALEAESKAADAAKALLDRKSVQADVSGLPGFEDRFMIRLKSTIAKDHWKLEAQQLIWLSPSVPGKAGMFDLEPTQLPNARVQKWRATSVIIKGDVVAVLDNYTTPELAAAAKNTGRVYLDVVLDREDPLGDRSSRAINKMRKVLLKENGEDIEADIYRLPLSGFFLEKKPFPSNIDPLPYRDTSFQKFVVRLQLEAESHRRAIDSVFQSPTGCALIQGPPATGKTTVVAKSLLIARGFVDLRGKIVCAAHTNEAVRVACERTVQLAKQMFHIDPKDHICLVLTRAKSQYFRLSEKEFGILEDLTLEAHMKRIADAQPATYGAYRAGFAQIIKCGRIEDKRLAKAHDKDRAELSRLVMMQCTIFFSTLATCHDRDSFFGNRNFPCSLLVVDEASQATDVALFQAWLALNPRRVVMAGDQKQLAPYTESVEGAWAWGTSMFEKLQNKGCQRVMLDVQYRTVQNIYAGTNFHYDNLVRAHPSTVNRPFQLQLQQIFTLGELSFTDADGKKVVLDSNIKLFHITDTDCIKVGAGRSSANQQEFQFIAGMVAAFGLAGVSPSHIMALTGYNGQHILLADLEQDFPGLRARKIDSSQGGEADIVAFSVTRTMQSGIGFLQQSRRQNVGTSRAREAMYIVGNPNLFVQSKGWQGWFDSLKKANSNLVVTIKGPVKWKFGDRAVTLPASASAIPTDVRSSTADVGEKLANMKLEPKLEKENWTDNDCNAYISGLHDSERNPARHFFRQMSAAKQQDDRTQWI